MRPTGTEPRSPGLQEQDVASLDHLPNLRCRPRGDTGLNLQQALAPRLLDAGIPLVEVEFLPERLAQAKGVITLERHTGTHVEAALPTPFGRTPDGIGHGTADRGADGAAHGAGEGHRRIIRHA